MPIGGVLGAVGSGLGIAGSLKGLFSKPKSPSIASARQQQAPFPGIFTPGLRLEQAGGGGPFTLSRLGDVSRVQDIESQLLNALEHNRSDAFSATFPRIAETRGLLSALEGRMPGLLQRGEELRGGLRDLQKQVSPGFGALTEARVRGIRSGAAQATGNLRSSLEKRNLLGSSFANQQISGVQQQFAQEEERARAEAAIQEIELQRQIIGDIGSVLQLDQRTLAQQAQLIGLRMGLTDQESGIFANQLANIQTNMQLLQQRVNRELQELAIPGNIINGVQALVTEAAIQQAKLTAQAAADQGSAFATLGTSIGDFGKAIEPLFGSDEE